MGLGHWPVHHKAVDLTDQIRSDGWTNVVTQLGTAMDKRLANRVFWEQHSPEFFEQLYTGDELASRIVNVVPEEALRRGWELINVDKKIQIQAQKRCEDLDLRGGIDRSWKWGRAYGGACLYIVTETDDPASPLRIGERVIGLRDLSRYDLRILTTDVETDFGSPNWGHPRVYYLVVQMGSQFKGYPIHWTRMVRFDGYLVPRRTFIRNNYWHDSILNRLYNAIRNYQTSNDAAASILQDFNVGIYKMKNLANLMAADKEDVVKKRIEMLNFSKSVIRAMILDADDEEYEDLSRSVEGLAELLTKQANRLVAATDITHTKLLGESPDGSNATGNSTTQQWFDHIQSEQENYLRPKLRRLFDAIFYDIPELDFKFKSLYQLTDLEQADLRNKQAQTDQVYLSTGVLDPSEIAQSRFGGDDYSTETKLDKEAREAGLIGAGSGLGQQMPPQFSPVDPNEQANFQTSNENLPPEGYSQPGLDEAGLPAGSPMYQPEGNPQYAPQAFDPNAASHEQSVEEAGLPESLQPFNPSEDAIESRSAGTGYELRNQEEPGIPEKTKAFISQTMSEPMRDPRTDPKIKPGGRPNQPRIIMPTRGNGVTAPSGNQYKTDAGESAFMQRQLDQPKSMDVQNVSVIGVISGSNMLLGKRRDTGKWVLPGGGAEPDEKPEDTASRELKEEAGIEVPANKMHFIGTSMGKTEEGLFSVSTFIVNAQEQPAATGVNDPDQEVDHWEWIDISKGLPPEIAENLEHENVEPFKQLGVL